MMLSSERGQQGKLTKMTWLSLQISSFCRDALRLSTLISSFAFLFKSAKANPYASHKSVFYYSQTMDANTVKDYV